MWVGTNAMDFYLAIKQNSKVSPALTDAVGSSCKNSELIISSSYHPENMFLLSGEVGQAQ